MEKKTLHITHANRTKAQIIQTLLNCSIQTSDSHPNRRRLKWQTTGSAVLLRVGHLITPSWVTGFRITPEVKSAMNLVCSKREKFKIS